MARHRKPTYQDRRDRLRSKLRLCPDCSGGIVSSFEVDGETIHLSRHDDTCPLATYAPGTMYEMPGGNFVKVGD